MSAYLQRALIHNLFFILCTLASCLQSDGVIVIGATNFPEALDPGSP